MKIGPIESGITAPSVINASPIAQTLEKMKPGDSVVIEGCNDGVRSAVYREAKKAGIFVVSKPDGDDKLTIRFWRLAEKPPRKYARKPADSAK